MQEIQENKETLHSHEWGNETVNTPATCNTDGSATVTCSSCGATEDRTISATGEHNFGDWTLVTAATADTPGEEKRVCNDCGTEETREIPVSDNTDNKLENQLTDNSDGTDNVLSGETEIIIRIMIMSGFRLKARKEERNLPAESAEAALYLQHRGLYRNQRGRNPCYRKAYCRNMDCG